MPGPAPITDADPRRERWPGRARARDLRRLAYIARIFRAAIREQYGSAVSGPLSYALAIAYRIAQTEEVGRRARAQGRDYAATAFEMAEEQVREREGVAAWLPSAPPAATE